MPASEFSLQPVQQSGELAHCRGQGGDHMVAKDCAAQFVEGWDWMVPVPDRGTGIWDDVSVTWTGPVLLQVLTLPVHQSIATQGLLRLTQKGGYIPNKCTRCNTTCQEVRQIDGRGRSSLNDPLSSHCVTHNAAAAGLVCVQRACD